MSLDRKILVGVTLLALGLWAFANHQYSQLDHERLQAIAAHQKAVLEIAGWQEAASQSAEEIHLPSLESEVQAADEAGTDIVLAVNTNSQAVVVELPLPASLCPPVVPSVPGATSPTGATESTTTLDSSSLSVQPSLEMRVDMDALGNLFYTGKILVHLNAPSLNLDTTTKHTLEQAQVALGKEITTAIEYYRDRPPRFTLHPRGFRHVRFGWTLGVGVSYLPDSSLHPSISVLWGVQF